MNASLGVPRHRQWLGRCPRKVGHGLEANQAWCPSWDQVAIRGAPVFPISVLDFPVSILGFPVSILGCGGETFATGAGRDLRGVLRG